MAKKTLLATLSLRCLMLILLCIRVILLHVTLQYNRIIREAIMANEVRSVTPYRKPIVSSRFSHQQFSNYRQAHYSIAILTFAWHTL